MPRRSLLELKDPAGLTITNWYDFGLGGDGFISVQEFEYFLDFYDAFWFAPNAPSFREATARPHACLTSGMHSNGFINLGSVLKEHAAFRRLVAWCLVQLSIREGVPSPAMVVGSDTSATDLVRDVGTWIGATPARMVKQDDGSQLWGSGNRRIRAGELVAQFEELMTTAKSSLAVREGARAGNPQLTEINWSPLLITVVDRSDPVNPLETVDGSRVVSIFRYPIKNWKTEECPWCQVGSEAIKLKEGDNWSRLVGANR